MAVFILEHDIFTSTHAQNGGLRYLVYLFGPLSRPYPSVATLSLENVFFIFFIFAAQRNSFHRKVNTAVDAASCVARLPEHQRKFTGQCFFHFAQYNCYFATIFVV